jgi:hypothetical protein
MAQQWLSASDPFFSQFSGTVDESGYVAGPYDSQVAGLQSPQNWEAVAPQLGWTGPLRAQYIGPDGNVMEDYSPEFLNWIQSKRAEGYDFVTDASQINKDRQTIGFRLPTGEVTNQRTVKVSGFGDFFKEFVLPSVGAYFGAGALGNALSPLTNALTGAGAAGGGAGAAMGAGIAEGMAPGALAPASAAELGAVNALTGAAPAVGATAPAMTGAGTPASALASGAQAAGAAAKAGTPAAGPTGIDLLDKAINFVTTPAGAAIVTGAGNIVGGIAAGEAAKSAAQTQAASADAATQLQRDIYNKFMEMNKPYYEAGVNALGQITRGEVTAEPGYGFRLGEGMKALERLQASRGNLLSGGAMKAGQRFAQDLASEEYGKSFNRLANIAGIGQTAASQAGAAGQNYAGQAGELGMQGANALVSGRIGRTSAYTSGAQGAINALQGYQAQQRQDQLLNRMLDIYGRTGG